jgi:hypothetical protein
MAKKFKKNGFGEDGFGDGGDDFDDDFEDDGDEAGIY